MDLPTAVLKEAEEATAGPRPRLMQRFASFLPVCTLLLSGRGLVESKHAADGRFDRQVYVSLPDVPVRVKGDTVRLEQVGLACRRRAAAPGEDYVEVITPNGYRISWNTLEMVKGMEPNWVEPAGVRMALAFKLAVEAGRAAYEIGLAAHSLEASATSPLT